ncbi:MAG: endolytic transglycosylase MltG [Deltaproteobacteria bacterium]|nr:MAG: endolytic transglycosylase MltG [Deltaproteobacteria bacterium]
MCQAHHLFSTSQFENAARDRALLAKYGIDGPTAEGFLFPDTYNVVRGSSPQALVEAMLQRFFGQLQTLPGAKALSPQALYDRVILASIVERETFDREELPVVAGVFHNRLEHDLKLESCATVQYLLEVPKPRLDAEDIRIDSPYNTYRHLGLPPGPIANPGLAALRAALAPQEHDLLYFVSLEDGTHRHHFSRTLAEHQKAVRQSFGVR